MNLSQLKRDRDLIQTTHHHHHHHYLPLPQLVAVVAAVRLPIAVSASVADVTVRESEEVCRRQLDSEMTDSCPR